MSRNISAMPDVNWQSVPEFFVSFSTNPLTNNPKTVMITEYAA